MSGSTAPSSSPSSSLMTRPVVWAAQQEATAIKDDKIEAKQASCQLAYLVHRLFLPQRIASSTVCA